MGIDEQRFKEGFIAAFIGAWVANEYTDACAFGKHGKLENPPLEDAFFLAGRIYQKYKEDQIYLDRDIESGDKI